MYPEVPLNLNFLDSQKWHDDNRKLRLELPLVKKIVLQIYLCMSGLIEAWLTLYTVFCVSRIQVANAITLTMLELLT